MKIYRNQETNEHVEFTGYLMGVDPVNLKAQNDPDMWVGIRPLGAEHIRVMPKAQFHGTHIEVEPHIAGAGVLAESLYKRLKIVNLFPINIVQEPDPNYVFLTAFFEVPESPEPIVRQEVLDGVMTSISNNPWANLLAPFSIVFNWEDQVKVRYNFVKAEPSKTYNYEKTLNVASSKDDQLSYTVRESGQDEA